MNVHTANVSNAAKSQEIKGIFRLLSFSESSTTFPENSIKVYYRVCSVNFPNATFPQERKTRFRRFLQFA